MISTVSVLYSSFCIFLLLFSILYTHYLIFKRISSKTNLCINVGGTVSGGQSTGNFAVSNGRGTLTIRSSQEWPVGTYIVTVRDLSSSVTSEVTDSFEVRKGDLLQISLYMVDWKNRYKANNSHLGYSISQSIHSSHTISIRYTEKNYV